MQSLFDPAEYPDLLVGLQDPDDAAIWRIDPDHALVITTDFFTPVVDDPFDYGQIAAANSLSDVYAMGGKPFMALNIAALPPDLPTDVSGEILRGGAQTCKEAGVVVAGGHTVQDKEPKFGLVAVGYVHPEKFISKRGALPGDALVLTKPLGFGVTTTALKQERADPSDVDEVVRWMKLLNKSASELALRFNLRGGTDISGFSLLGHGVEMAEASGVSLQIKFNKIPFVSGAKKYARMYSFPGGATDNSRFFGSHVVFKEDLPEEERMLLFDPQTSGGLLLSIPDSLKVQFLQDAKKENISAWEIGCVKEGSGVEIVA